MHKRWFHFIGLAGVGLLVLVLGGCNFAVATPTATPEPSLTPSATATPSLTPTATPSPTVTLTPTPSPTPTITFTPSPTPLPTVTPYPAAVFVNDQWRSVDVPSEIRGGLQRSWFAILSLNEQGGTTDPQTPAPTSEQETVYLIEPYSGQRIAVLDLPASTGSRVYWSPDGRSLVYFLEPGVLPDGSRVGGLYLLNLSLGVNLRLFDIPTLNPHNIPDHVPVWSPDGSQFAIVLPTAYDTDIFIIAADGSVFQNATAHGSFDLWPAWSPDGRRLAFVSDRQQCPSWTPGEPGSCATLDAGPPTGGNLFVLDVETGQAQQVSEVWLDGPPTWVSNLQIAFITGLSDLAAGKSEIWLSNIQSGTARRISDPEGGLNLGAAWSPGGLQVMYHRATDPAAILLKDPNGNLIGSTDAYLFSRFGFAATWSPGGEWVAMAGRDGQCPYGLMVADSNLTLVYGPPSAPRACDPSYSPDGSWLAYAGIQSQPGVDDGRLDLFIAQPNGYGSRNLTSSLRGDIYLLGWVGGAS